MPIGLYTWSYSVNFDPKGSLREWWGNGFTGQGEDVGQKPQGPNILSLIMTHDLVTFPPKTDRLSWGWQTFRLFFHHRFMSRDEPLQLVHFTGTSNINQFLFTHLGCYNKILCAKHSSKHLTQIAHLTLKTFH